MRTIAETIELHRATRRLYMTAARSAWRYRDAYGLAVWMGYGVGRMPGFINIVPAQAIRCFIRHARAANRKLVAVKRFGRQFSHAINLGYEANGDEGDHLLGKF